MHKEQPVSDAKTSYVSTTTNNDEQPSMSAGPFYCSLSHSWTQSRKSSSDTAGTSSDDSKKGKRLDEDLEQLDQHLMDITLKNVKYMQGSKFTVFSDVAFQRDFLEAHNAVRTKHQCPHLTWCQNLAEQAAEWAQHIAEKGRVLYKELPNIGENVILITTNGTNHLPTGTEITETWAKQADKYDFKSSKWSIECQNFTQLIWKSTQQVGAGRVWLQSKGVVAVVAFYFPRGNRNGFGEFQKNVLPPLTQ